MLNEIGYFGQTRIGFTAVADTILVLDTGVDSVPVEVVGVDTRLNGTPGWVVRSLSLDSSVSTAAGVCDGGTLCLCALGGLPLLLLIGGCAT